MIELPESQSQRWQPLRCGLVEIFYYDEETFHFHDGRLLLRGNNGTGKSKVMALTLPFLLDGQLIPSRVEPDGDSAKRMEWNLLVGEYQERLGYTWLEFGRQGEAGPETFTVGCGLKAVAGRPVRSWFFTTPQRIGRDLFLIDKGRSLSRERLGQSLGSQGQLYDRAADYRRAIDERLFRLGEQRYGALLDLLLQLRQPQLAKKPDPNRLSQALSDALPPLGRGLIGEVAEAYRSLDVYREEIQGLEETARAVDAFLGHYRHYAGIAVRRRAEGLTGANAEYERVRLQLGRDRQAHEQTLETRDALGASREALAGRQRDLAARQRTLEASDAMRSAEALGNAEELARQRRNQAERQAHQLDREQENHRRAETRLAEAEQALETDVSALARKREASAELADGAGVGAEHRRQVAVMLPAADSADPAPPAPGEIDALQQALRDLHRRREEGVTYLNRRLDEVGRGEGAFHRVEHEARREEETLASREEEWQEALTVRLEAAEALQASWRERFATLKELTPEDPEALLAELAPWCDHLSGSDPAEAGLSAARDARREGLNQQRHGLAQQRRELDAERAEREAERRRLEAGDERTPPEPYTRGEGARDARPGAPLWQLVDFHPSLGEGQRAGLEAALEAAGLLDAWVLPEGELLAPDTWDTLLAPMADGDAPMGEASLAGALRADPPAHSPVAADVVERLLAGIGLGDSEAFAWVSPDGAWRLGQLSGRWGKPAAVYIGHAAREAARQRRLIEIQQALDALATQDAEIVAALEILEARLQVVEQEWQQRPTAQALRDAHANEAAARRARDTQADRLDQAREALEEAREALEALRGELYQAAEDLRLPAEREPLGRIQAALNDYRLAASELVQAITTWRQAKTRHDEQLQERQVAGEALQQAQWEHAEALEQAREAEVRRDTLRETMGAEVQELERQLAAIQERSEALTLEQREQAQRFETLLGEVARLAEKVAHGEQRLAELDERRAEMIAAFRALVEEGLLRVAAPEAFAAEEPASWAADPAVRLARAAAQATAGADASDESWHAHQGRLHEHIKGLTDVLSRGGHDCLAEARDDLLLVRIVFQGRRQDPDALFRQLNDEIGQRQALLNARERELLETYLIDEVASHIQECITATERHVLAMNRELESRPTSTGMRLRIRWQPLTEGQIAGGMAAPAGLADVCQRLRRQALDAWSPEDREVVGDFLRRRIEEARASDEGGALQEILERALDYRFWHRFVVERHQNGQWRPAYGPASGGERALVITLPLFAAAASHYGSAHEDAPRLVMLDEVFAGIDDDARAKSMGLLAQFDLDAVMTSEREWGCYPDVPGLAIAQLVRREGVDAVHVTRWKWDGKRRVRDELPASQMREPQREAIGSESEGGMDSLF
ncbi:TIGR02680 family protein [Halomonas campisalis]|uniref:TIGR02680 family protein n=1 Tax=Billgrantia campisalis TaxID=74661 RepID=A0ABS9P609_9GAMM|nr:TIGR02680 family protein [Halomonas campisalis]MCG6657208.1 TIGR02680 family protein [Halomonas campisalis]MDR5862393.1 TIGR02680 family protein [Halomonas campisalis]